MTIVNNMSENSCPQLVSIMIPVFNREEYLGECIESALAQTIQNIEILLVDNCSTDSTWSICQKFAAQDPRIRIFRNEQNIGPVKNWLRCVKEARGEYGKILFSDDLIEPRFLEECLPFFEDLHVAFVFTAAKIGSSPRQGVINYRWKCQDGKTSALTFIEDALFGGDIPLSPGAAIFRIDDLRRNLFWNIPSWNGSKFAEHGAGPDTLLYLLTATQYAEVAFIAEPLVFFRSHPDSITIRKGQDDILESYRQARFWFAQTRLDERITSRLLVRTWFSDINKRKRWISFSRHVGRYSPDVSQLTAFKAVFLLLYEVFYKMRKCQVANKPRTHKDP